MTCVIFCEYSRGPLSIPGMISCESPIWSFVVPSVVSLAWEAVLSWKRFLRRWSRNVPEKTEDQMDLGTWEMGLVGRSMLREDRETLDLM